MLKRPFNQVEILNADVIREGDRVNYFLVRLIDIDGSPVDVSNSNVTWSMGNKHGTVISNKDALKMEDIGVVKLKFWIGDGTGYGKFSIQIEVENGGVSEFFPSDDSLEVFIPKNLNNLSHTPVAFMTVNEFQNSVSATLDAANSAEVLANEAKTQAVSTQNQLNQMVITGDSSVEAAQARESISGASYTTLKERNDEEFLRFKNDLSQRNINVRTPPYNARCDGETDDTEAIRAAIRKAEELGTGIHVPGVSVITGELEFKKPISVTGTGSGFGYGRNGLPGYKQTSGFLVRGTGQKRIRTRRNYRGSSADPQDAPLSVVANIQHDGANWSNISIKLDFDSSNNSPTNLGADWDVGIFVGCRTKSIFHNVHVMGYFRDASFYFDVTHATNLPRFNDLNGNAYDNTNNTSGADGTAMFDVMTQGGKWGIKVAGALPQSGAETYGNTYYDETLGASVPDWRGTFGSSDFSIMSSSIYGTDHHSDRRIYPASGDYLTDNSGGSIFVDGLANNANQSLQGFRFISTRFATFEAYRVRLGRANRIQFIGCHIEDRAATNKLNADGTPITNVYGMISATTKTNNILIIGYNGGFIHDSSYIPSNVVVYNFAPAGTSLGSAINEVFHASGFKSISGDVNIQSKTSSHSIVFKLGDVTKGYYNTNGLLLDYPVIRSSVGELDLRSASGSPIRLRSGTSTIAFLDPAAWRSNSDNAVTLGTPGARFAQLFSATGTINTSDENYKQDIKEIDDVVLNAWSEVNYAQFRFKDSYEAKGEDARYHFGVIAQEIEKAFEGKGLNAFDYGILCYDEWEDIYEEIEKEVEEIDEGTGETRTKIIKTGEYEIIRPAGSQYSIRPDECMMLESALMRRELNELKKALK